jgi:methionine synthase II (cobalamin-independent)
MMPLPSNSSTKSTAILIILNVHSLLSCLIKDDTPRAGNFEPLAHLPKNKTVVLGLISSKLPDLEDPKQIAGRIDEAAKILGDLEKKRICLSPQCGFASHIEGNKVSSSL